MRAELIALCLVLMVVLGVPSAVVLYDGIGRPQDEMTLVAHTPLHGNWSIREIHIPQGTHLRLRLTSEDVTHGFLVPDLNINAGPISPGRYKTVDIAADRPGTYNFYCNTLCSHEHGAMVGKIVVE